MDLPLRSALHPRSSRFRQSLILKVRSISLPNGERCGVFGFATHHLAVPGRRDSALHYQDGDFDSSPLRGCVSRLPVQSPFFFVGSGPCCTSFLVGHRQTTPWAWEPVLSLCQPSSSREQPSHWAFEIGCSPLPEAVLTDPPCIPHPANAPKRRIGGSGPSAAAGFRHISAQQSPFELVHSRASFTLLQSFGLWFCALFRSLLGLITILMLRMLFQGLPRAAPLRAVRHMGSWCDSYYGALMPLAAAGAPALPALRWEPRHQGKRRATLPCPAPSLRLLPSVLLFLLGSLPHCVWATPVGLPEGLREAEHLFMHLPERLPPASTADNRLHDGPSGAALVDDVAVLLPLPRDTQQHFSRSTWLGVTVFRPFFQPQHFGLRCQRSAGLSALLQQVVQQQVLAGRNFGEIVPTADQRFNGYAHFLAVPPLLDQLGQVAIIIDTTRVGGAYYAFTLPSRITVDDLSSLIWKETDGREEHFTVWVSYSTEPQPCGAMLELKHGDVITVLRPHVPSERNIPISRLFEPDTQWDDLHHMPTHSMRPATAIHYQGDYDCFRPEYFPTSDIYCIVSQALRKAAHSIELCLLDVPPDIDHRGRHCKGTAVVWDKVADFDTDDDSAPPADTPCVLHLHCDPRLFGLPPTVLQLRVPGVTDAQVFAGLGLDFSHSRAPTIEATAPVTRCGGALVAAVRLITGFGLAPGGSPSTSVPVTRLHPNPAPTLQQLLHGGPGADPPTDATPLPPEDAALPPWLGPVPAPRFAPPPEDDADDAPIGDAIQAKFMILRMECTIQVVQVTIAVSAFVTDALDAIVSAMDHDTFLLYSQLVPIFPQLSPAWGAVLALPAWAHNEPVSVIDLRKVDGRLFVCSLPFRFTRDTLCNIVGVRTDVPIAIYPYGAQRPLEHDQECELLSAGSIIFVPQDAHRPPGLHLATMLSSRLGWDPDVVLPREIGGPRGEFVCTVLPMGHHLFIIDYPRGQHLEAISRAYDIPLHLTTVQATHPRIPDAVVKGFWCKGVAAVSNELPNVPAPPGLSQHGRFLVLVDCRPILQGWMQLLTQEHVYSHSELCDHFSTFMPAGWQPQIEGATLEGDHLRLRPGQVLTVQYVQLTPEPSLAERSSTADHSSSDDDDDSEDSDDSDSNPPPPPPPRRNRHQRRNAARPAAPDAMRPDTVRSRSPHRDRTAQPTALVCVALGRLLLVSWMLMPTVRAVQLPPFTADATAVPAEIVRVDMWSPVFCHDTHSIGPRDLTPIPAIRVSDCAEFGAVHPQFRPLPTPCRNKCPLQIDHAGPTLLEEALQVPGCQAFFLASTLIETLIEHFSSSEPTPAAACTQPQAQTPASCPLSVPVSLSLAQLLPVTAFQQDCLDLLAILPPTRGLVDPWAVPDWLDADLTGLLGDRQVPLELRTAFLNLHTWAGAGYPKPTAIEVFTDGSAATRPDDVTPCAWAISVWIVATGRTYLHGVAAEQASIEQAPFHVGESDDTSCTAELLALVWALVWAVEFGVHYGVDITFKYDATSVGFGVFGEASIPCTQGSPYTALAAFACALRQYLQVQVRVLHAHVPGHAGHVPNELVDRLSKRARRMPTDHWNRCLPSWPHRLFQSPLYPWIWATLTCHPDTPTLFAFESEALRLQKLGRRIDQPPSQGLCEQRHHAGHVDFAFTCITFNALTLRDPTPAQARALPAGLRMLGRKGVLKHSLAAFEPLFIGLQETRLPDSGCQPDPGYIILQSAATDAGTCGCALWISRERPIATLGSEKCYIRDEHVTVVSFSPRHLAATVVLPRISLLVLVMHVPSLSTTPYAEVQAFWKARTDDIAKRPEGAEYIILADTNSTVGTTVSRHVGDYAAEPEQQAGALFHEFLVTVDGLLPSTQTDLHFGCSTTWISPTGSESRLDFVIVPTTWCDFELRSTVLDNVELLQLREDHRPALLRCAFCRYLPASRCAVSRKQVVRPSQDFRHTTQALQVLGQVPRFPWELSTDQHYDALALSWRQQASQLTSAASEQPRQPYLSVSTLATVRQRQVCRAHLQADKVEQGRRLKLVAFAAFLHNAQGSTFHQGAVLQADQWLSNVDYSIARLATRLRHLCRQLRTAVANDRKQYLEGLVQAAADRTFANPRELYATLRKAFPAARAARRANFRPLPMLQFPDGSTAVTPQDRSEAWRAHFASQEAGILVTGQQYVDKLAYLADSQPEPVFQLDTMPTLGQLEQTVLSLKSNKAAGPDGITSEVLRLHAPTTTRQLMPVVLKVFMRIQEPVSWRGGNLVVLAKKASSILTCDQYRSILISSVPGKVVHRCIRDQLKPFLLQTQPDMQAGVRPAVGIEVPALAIRSFVLLRAAKRLPWGVTFVDLQAAFYSVVRQSLVPNADSDEGFLRLLHSLQLPPSATAELRDHLRSITEIPACGAGPHLVRIIQDLFTGTWFRLQGEAALTMTAKGTRPGDPAADILFAFTLSAFVRSTDLLLASKGLVSQQLEPPARPDWAVPPPTIQASSPSWADDIARPHAAPTTWALIELVRGTVGLLYNRARALGMTIKFGAEKTALLLSEADRRDARPQLDQRPSGDWVLRLKDDIASTWVELPVVTAYKHLGGVLVSTASPVPDLHFRFSRADGTARSLRRQLFSSQRFTLDVRRSLLSALVVSKYLHTSAALVLRRAAHLRTWERHFVALWRNLCKRGSDFHHIHPFEVLRRARACTPPLALAKARASFLAKILQTGPVTLAAQLCDHWLLHPASSWLGQLEEDFRHVSQYVPELVTLAVGTAAVPLLVAATCEDGKWWLRKIQQAERLLTKDLDRWRQPRPEPDPAAPVDAVPGPFDPRLPPPVPPTLAYQCHLCAKGFRLRKHLHVHLSRTHGWLSPSRHYALSEVCQSCLKLFDTVRQTQQHLKTSSVCLRRSMWLYPPLSKAEIAIVEAPVRLKAKGLRTGQWKTFEGLPPPRRAPTIVGPRFPTAQERQLPMLPTEDDLLIELKRPYTPDSSTVDWIEGYIAGRSTEGPRTTAVRFWQQRPQPTFHPFAVNLDAP